VSIATLLTAPPLDDSPQQAAWEFENAMAQRSVLGAMAPLANFSGLPYNFMLSPMSSSTGPASSWLLSLQAAIDNAGNALPSAYGATTLGFPVPQILVNEDLTDPSSLQLWTFDNWNFLNIATATVIPYPAYPELTYPFW
jgi:hypothetical protein